MPCTVPNCIACRDERRPDPNPYPFRHDRIVFDRCPGCNGSGWQDHYLDGRSPCTRCGGTGRKRGPRCLSRLTIW